MKKASLSLSMNAIVILILAITLLGLGLSFMRGLFKQMEAKVGVAISAQELTNPPTTDNPLTLAPSKIDMREGENKEVITAFMNVLASDANCDLNVCEPAKGACTTTGKGLCEGPGDINYKCNLTIVYNNNTLNLKKDQINSYTLAIYAPSDSSGGVGKTHLYTAKMTCDTNTFTKDLVVVVKP